MKQPVAGRSSCPCRAASSASRSRNSRSTARGSVPGSQRRVPSSQHSCGILVVDLAAVDLADEDAGRPADRVGAARRARSSSRPSRATSSAPAAMTLGSSAGRMTSWTGGPARRMRDLPGGRAPAGDRQARRTAARGAARRRRRSPSRISWSSCRPSPQGASCRSWAVSRTEPAVRAPGVAQRAQRLDRGGDAPLHVRRAAAGELAVLDRRRHERQVHGVEVAVELERPARAGRSSNRTTTAGRVGIARRRAARPRTRRPSRISASRSQTAPASPVRLGTSISRTAVSTSRSRLM